MIKQFLAGLLISLTLFTGLAVLAPAVSYAAGSEDCFKRSILGFPTWYEYLEVGEKKSEPPEGSDAAVIVDKCAIVGPKVEGSDEFSFQKALPRIALALSEILLRIAGMVAVGYTIFGGFKYMTSQGEPDALKSAQGTVANALIGLVISVLAVTIVSFIGRTLWN